MSQAITIGHGAPLTLNARRKHLTWCLFLAGLFSIAAVQSCQLERRKCGPFAIGQSAIGSCDYIAGEPRE